MTRPRFILSSILWLAVAGLLGAAGPAACGGIVLSDGEPGGSDDPDPGASSDHSSGGAPSGGNTVSALEENCAIVCNALLALNCSENVACASQCVQSHADAGGCAGLLADYIACFADHIEGVTCSTFAYECDDAYSAYATCSAGG